jgi:hypothetical protein
VEGKIKGGAMKDTHIHTGQFEDAYYEPLAVIDIVMASGMEGLSFSSATSCKDDVRYGEVEREISMVYAGTAYSPETIRPFLWFIPDYIRQGVSVESACCVIPYKGIKIHPLANSWDLEDLKQREALHELFDYAQVNQNFVAFFMLLRQVPQVLNGTLYPCDLFPCL